MTCKEIEFAVSQILFQGMTDDLCNRESHVITDLVDLLRKNPDDWEFICFTISEWLLDLVESAKEQRAFWTMIRSLLYTDVSV